jgi:hypothetical protein
MSLNPCVCDRKSEGEKRKRKSGREEEGEKGKGGEK